MQKGQFFTNAKIDEKLKLDRRLYLNFNKEWWEAKGINEASIVSKTEYIFDNTPFLDEDLCTRTKINELKVVMAGNS